MQPPADQLGIDPCGPVTGRVRPPGSKSLTNRALVCAALAHGPSRLVGVLQSEDTDVMMAGLKQLGITLQPGEQPQEWTVLGCGGTVPRDRAELQVANSGTTVRFLTALVCLGRGSFRLDGIPRMRERPIRDLLDALRQLGADARDELHTGCPPVVIEAHGLAGGHVSVRGDISSQFLSGLLMAAPYAQSDVEVVVAGPLVSRPYVHMTLELMRGFGAKVHEPHDNRFLVSAGHGYVGRTYVIEPDASAASYFWAAAAITGGRVTVEGLSRESVQGDVGFCDCLRQMGCDVTFAAHSVTVQGGPLHGVSVNMNGISDTVQTLAAVALFAQSPTRIHGVEHIRHKETDRIGDLARELRKVGAVVHEFPDGLEIVPQPLTGSLLDTYNDHRMAMSLALIGLRVPGVVIRNPACTGKTYPGYFHDLGQLIQTGQAP